MHVHDQACAQIAQGRSDHRDRPRRATALPRSTAVASGLGAGPARRRRLVQRLRDRDRLGLRPGVRRRAVRRPAGRLAPARRRCCWSPAPVTRNMAEPLRRTYEAAAQPRGRRGAGRLRPQLRGLRRRRTACTGRSRTSSRSTSRCPGCPPAARGDRGRAAIGDRPMNAVARPGSRRSGRRRRRGASWLPRWPPRPSPWPPRPARWPPFWAWRDVRDRMSRPRRPVGGRDGARRRPARSTWRGGVDPLSAVFMVVVGRSRRCGAVRHRYVRRPAAARHGPDRSRRPRRLTGRLDRLRLLRGGMLLVAVAGSAVTFLLCWELMALTSLLLVLAEHREHPAVRSGRALVRR